jgi:hypothetical protein
MMTSPRIGTPGLERRFCSAQAWIAERHIVAMTAQQELKSLLIF